MSKRRLTAVLMAVVMLLAASCGSGDQSSSAAQESSVAQGTSRQEEESSVPVESAATDSSEASSVPEESSEEESVPVVEQTGNLNPLTGLMTLSDEAVGKRPVAIVINNIKDSLPQYGIAGADIIFEMVAEAGITRLLGVWGDYTQIPDVCSVRSSRPYFVDLAAGFDALYIHVGGSQAGLDRIEELGLDNFDGRYTDPDIFDRDPNRLGVYAYEHTMYVKGQNIPAQMEAYGMRTDLGENYQDTAFLFNDPAHPVSNTEEACEKITIHFSDAYYSTFTYNASDRLYYKEHSGEPHMVQDTGTQLAFTNVLILESEISSLDGYRMSINTESGTGYYISNGVLQEIRWSKATPYDRIQITDEDGNEVALNAGKTYVGITEYDSETFG